MKKLLCLPLILAASDVKATIESVSFNVRGVHCHQCVRSILDKVKDVSGVKKAQIEDGAITLTLDEEDNFSLKTLKNTVEHNAAYKIKRLTISARGPIVKQGRCFYLENPRNQEKIYLMKEPAEDTDNEENKKKTNAFIAASSRAWHKTSEFFTKILLGNDTFEKDVISYYKNNIPVQLKTCVHEHASGSFWVSYTSKKIFGSAPYTKLSHIKSEHKGKKKRKSKH